MEQMTLFGNNRTMTPLASRVRPDTLDEFVGQEHLLGKGKILRQLIEQDHISSMIFWGPPGVGKTTLASIIAGRTRSEFINFSAVTSGIKEIKEVMKQAEQSRRAGMRTVLFVDEIHRFNKAQQDAFLPFVERGKHYSDRSDNRKSVFRNQRSSSFPLQSLCAESAGGEGSCKTASQCAGKSERLRRAECEDF